MAETALVESLTETVIALTRHLEMENDILAARRPEDLQPLAAEKQRLSDAYLKDITVLKRNPETLEGVPAALTDRLKAAGRDFEAVLDEHHRRVAALKSVSEGLIQSISDEVASRNRPVAGYGERALPEGRGAATPTSIALNQVI